MLNKNLTPILIIFSLVALVTLSTVSAKLGDGTLLAQAAENAGVTYGQCVTTAANARQTCYDIALTAKDSCKTFTGQNKELEEKCNTGYKEGKANCKQLFKDTKKNVCAKIKHNFLEIIRYSFT